MEPYPKIMDPRNERGSDDSVPDFPRMTEEELKIFFTETYQLSQSISYLAELINDDNTINLRIHRDNSTILKMEVQSRHIKRRTHRCYVDYAPNSTGLNAIRRVAARARHRFKQMIIEGAVGRKFEITVRSRDHLSRGRRTGDI